MDLFSKNATVVLVHGAWADGSSWNRVILPLLQQGLKVICAPIPLTSLSDDAAALNRVIERTDGPVLLAGHAYAGAEGGYCLRATIDCGPMHSGTSA
jgi:pimeloyl-ACP methyl ester carboxylesterase